MAEKARQVIMTCVETPEQHLRLVNYSRGTYTVTRDNVDFFLGAKG